MELYIIPDKVTGVCLGHTLTTYQIQIFARLSDQRSSNSTFVFVHHSTQISDPGSLPVNRHNPISCIRMTPSRGLFQNFFNIFHSFLIESCLLRKLCHDWDDILFLIGSFRLTLINIYDDTCEHRSGIELNQKMLLYCLHLMLNFITVLTL